MGCTMSVGANDEQDKSIQKKLAQERKRMEQEVKLLLLGAGESGKSTFAKQMKIIHLRGFSDQEKQSFRAIIHDNIMTSALSLIRGARQLDIEIEDTEAADALMELEDFTPEDLLEVKPMVKRLWADPGIQAALERASEFQLLDSTKYYLDKLDEVTADDYVPDEQDILHSRSKTTGIIETQFTVNKVPFRMVDVGGQRSERKKWMHCFQDVTAVIFCVALSAYDLKLDEDNATNRMKESLRLFNQICNNKWFLDTSVILFLNKRDLFGEKIAKVPLTVCFPEYTGSNDPDEAAQYVQGQFVEQNDNPNKSIYPHITVATDTGNIKHVFSAVKNIILQQSLTGTGMV